MLTTTSGSENASPTSGSIFIPVVAMTVTTVVAGYIIARYLTEKSRCGTAKCARAAEHGDQLPGDAGDRKRKMSFTSASMAMGAFPPERKVVDPIINVALFFASAEELPDVPDLIPVVEGMLCYDRCSGVPVGTVGGNDWSMKLCENVNPLNMVRVVECNGCDEAIFKTIERHLQDSLREGRGGLPWWECLVIKNKGPGKSSIVFRIEHFIGDGLSIVKLFERFISYADGSPMHGLIPVSLGAKFRRRESKVRTVLKSVSATLKVLTLAGSRFDDDIAFRNGTGRDMVHTGTRKVVIFNSLPLDFVKALKNAAGVTLNDILFAALSQAIHDYTVAQGCRVLKEKGENVQFRALMPVAFPRPKEETEDTSLAMRNKWVFVSSDMGVGYSNVMDRLSYIHDSLSKLKHSPMAYCQLMVQENIPPRLPTSIARQTVFDSFCRHSLVFSNVPGADKECLFAGKEVVGCHFIFNNLIPQVNILSYSGEIFMNIVLDPEAVQKYETLPVLFSKALVSLGENLNVEVPTLVLEHSRTIEEQ